MNRREKYSWLYDVLFLLVLVLAGYLRLSGVNWGGVYRRTNVRTPPFRWKYVRLTKNNGWVLGIISTARHQH